jgi:SpoVK/Ycf46/Vps4 family AAA+-type ATPase
VTVGIGITIGFDSNYDSDPDPDADPDSLWVQSRFPERQRMPLRTSFPFLPSAGVRFQLELGGKITVHQPRAVALNRAFSSLKDLIEGRRPLIYICSPEEERVRRLLSRAAHSLFAEEVPLWSWTLTGGLRDAQGNAEGPELMGPAAVLEFIAAHKPAGIFQLLDFHAWMRDDPEIRRRLRDLYGQCLDTGKYIAIVSPLRLVPEELRHQMAYLELQYPDLPELRDFLAEEFDALERRGFAVDRRESAVLQIARSLQGMTLDEARHALRRALTVQKRVDAASTPLLQEEKKLIVNKSRLVQYVADGTELDHVGGLQYLKQWLMERRKLFLERDEISAEIVPKGILVMGVSGCGKSLSVKAVASCFGLPLYRIDMVEVFSGVHGSPDAAFAEACNTVEILAPAVVWFDEIEMGLTTQSSEAATSMGRIFAFFLTWMQEKTRGLFVAATANRIDLLPAEMIRKGRFDEVFFIDLPIEEERVEVFRIHLQKRGVDPSGLQLGRLKKITQGWSGAEVEQCVVSALTAVRLQGRTLTFEDLHKAAQNVIPLSKTMREQVEHIRSWAYDRAVRASPRESAY